MLIQANSMDELDFDALMELYREGNLENGAYFYPREPAEKRLELAIAGFRSYLCEQFFKRENAQYWIWEENGVYLSALRFEKYRDGLLMEALETHPDHRKCGYAKKLICSVQDELSPNTVIYSHVSKRNTASLATHDSCGFLLYTGEQNTAVDTNTVTYSMKI